MNSLPTSVLKTGRFHAGLVRTTVLAATLATTLIASTPLHAEPVLRAEDISPFRVTYSVGNNLLTAGDATLELAQVDDERWRFSLETRPSGVFKLTGKGHVSETSDLRFVPAPDGFLARTDIYAYRQDEEQRRSVDAAFNWEDMTLAWTRRGESEVLSLADNPVMDRLSVMLAVMSALRQGEISSEFEVFDSGRIKEVIFEVQGEETLDTALGQIETLRVLRSNVAGSSRTTITWFAPSLDYMPVRVEQLKRGKLVARLDLQSLETGAEVSGQ